MDKFPVHAIQIGDFLIGPRDFASTNIDENYGFAIPVVNNSGGTLERGDVVAFQTGSAMHVTKANGNEIPNPMIVITGRTDHTYADGELALCLATGISECKVTGAITRGDLLVPAANGRAQAYSGVVRTDPATWPHHSLIVGEALGNNTSGDSTMFVKRI